LGDFSDHFGRCAQNNSGHTALLLAAAREQGRQMVCFQTKNPNLGKFCAVFQWKMLVYFTATWPILRPFGIFLWAIWCILWSFGIFSRFGM
jgi:hypothetical protein